jgi:hypothetical protein
LIGPQTASPAREEEDSAASSVFLIQAVRIFWDKSARSGLFGGMERSRQRRIVLDFNPEYRASIPAISSGLEVRSRWSREWDSGRNSASAMAPSGWRLVSERNRRLREVLTVKAVRRAAIYISAKFMEANLGLTPSRLGPQHGLLLRSRVSRVELYFKASPRAANPAGSMRLSLRLRTFKVRFRLST